MNEKNIKLYQIIYFTDRESDKRRGVTWAHGVHLFTQHAQGNEYLLPAGNSELPDRPGNTLFPFCNHSMHHFQNCNCFRTANTAPPEIINSPLPYIIQNRSEYILLTSLRLPLRLRSATRLTIDMFS